MAQWPSHWVLGSPSSHQDNREAGLLQIRRSWPGPSLLQEGEWGEAAAEYGFPRAPHAECHGQDFCCSGMLPLKRLTFYPIASFKKTYFSSNQFIRKETTSSMERWLHQSVGPYDGNSFKEYMVYFSVDRHDSWPKV